MDTSPNAHGGNTLVKLRKLLDEHERAASAIRTTLELLGASLRQTKQARTQTVLATAVQLDTARRGRPPGPVTNYNSAASIAARRQYSAELLTRFDRTEPRGSTVLSGTDVVKIGPLTRRGYLKRKGDGWVRTSKEYVP